MSVVKNFRELMVYREAFESVYEKVSGVLVNMMANADQWCIASNHVWEDMPTHPHTHTRPH